MIPSITKELPDGQTALYAWFSAMHTRVDILLKADNVRAKHLPDACRDVQNLISDIESEGNCFASDSLLSRLNAQPPDTRIWGGRYLYDMLDGCKRYNVTTGGYFDVAVESPNYYKGILDALELHADGSVSRAVADLKINLSGFIKGYALDKIKELLHAENIADAVVNMGNSSIMAIGDVPLRMDKPFMTTTGNSAKSPRTILNPHTGKVISACGQVSVFTYSGAEGEALATKSFIIGSEVT